MSHPAADRHPAGGGRVADAVPDDGSAGGGTAAGTVPSRWGAPGCARGGDASRAGGGAPRGGAPPRRRSISCRSVRHISSTDLGAAGRDSRSLGSGSGRFTGWPYAGAQSVWTATGELSVGGTGAGAGAGGAEGAPGPAGTVTVEERAVASSSAVNCSTAARPAASERLPAATSACMDSISRATWTGVRVAICRRYHARRPALGRHFSGREHPSSAATSSAKGIQAAHRHRRYLLHGRAASVTAHPPTSFTIVGVIVPVSCPYTYAPLNAVPYCPA